MPRGARRIRGGGCGQDALEIARDAADPYSEVAAYAGIGNLYLRQGDVDRASPLLARGLALCRDRMILEWLPRLASSMGVAHALQGSVDEAARLLEQAGARAGSMGMTWHPLWGVRLAEVYLLSGRLGEQARDLASARKERGHLAYTLRLLGEVAARRDPPALGTAEARYREARALAEELGMRPLVAHCHLGLGSLYRRLGRRTEARSELREAALLFRAMDMTRWLARAEAELAQE